MPTFFIDTYDGQTELIDRFGVELDSIAEASDEAAALLPDFAREMIPGGQSQEFIVAVRDQTDVVVYRAALLFRGRFAEPARERVIESFPPTGDDAIEQSKELRRQAREIGRLMRKATNELWGARLEANVTRKSSQDMREKRAED